MIKLFMCLSGSGMDRKIDFYPYLLVPAQYFLSKRTGRLTKTVYIPPCEELFLDSSGFSLMTKFNDYPFSLEQYVLLVKKLKPTYFATMDYPCELALIEKTSLSVRERIRRTIENTETLMNNYSYPSKLIPVVQGWTLEDYKFCILEMHRRDLLTDYIAFGTMCCRKSLLEVKKLIIKLTDFLWQFVDAKVHCFGLSIRFLRDFAIRQRIHSIDTSAWTFNSGNSKRFASNGDELWRNWNQFLNKVRILLSKNCGQITLFQLSSSSLHSSGKEVREEKGGRWC